ncbi:hypothetical protein B0T16DRAFT_247024 [Cercophora newfieldiana]|uniref:Uncharacterized protein n=1 Tax=Cercophora newfieldiana TaxID=92897 RepID=A0AA40CJR0_9PEZI|nr:hypothetical protein B0T16DRAFT_247024 [Cercophora newfieldiana]
MRDWKFCRVVIVWCLVAVALAEECASNPCLRAVASTTSQRNATADCISFFETTIKAATKTVTTTVTLNSTAPKPTKNPTTPTGKTKIGTNGVKSASTHKEEESQYEAFDKNQYGRALEESRRMPAYAAPCPSIGDYSSACSCLGISLPSTTVPRSTLTVTSTVTAYNGTGASFFRNSTMAFGNSTAPFRNTTAASKSTSSLLLSDTRTGKLSSPPMSKQSLAAAQQGGPAIPAGGKTTVHVIKATTVVASNTLWGNNSPSAAFRNDSSSRYWNSTAFSTANITSTLNTSISSNTTHWPWQRDTSSPAFSFGNSTRPIWLNTSLPTFTTNSTVRWPNTTALPTLNQTTVRWPNTTVFPTLNHTSVRWPNSTLRASNTSTPTPTSTPVPYPTTCGEENPPFHIQIASTDSPFNNWYISLVGNSLLFVSNLTTAGNFSVEPSGRLCAVGHLDSDGIPAVAAVERRVGVGPVWLLRKRTVEGLEGDYGVLSCQRDGEGLGCEVQAGEGAGVRSWVGCGIQLGAKREDGEGDGGGPSCEDVGVKVVG